MCDCVNRYKESIKEKYPECISVNSMNLDLFTGYTFSAFELKIKVKSKEKKEKLLVHNKFCPHCGINYADEFAKK